MTIIVFIFIGVLLTVLPPTGFPVEAQEATRHPIIGYLSISAGPTPTTDAFRQGLREFGYIEGQNISIEYRFAGGKLDRLPTLAAELVNLRVKLIVATVPVATRAAQDATQTIPIVMANGGDPIDAGLVATLASPGGNVTGLSNHEITVGSKRLELFKEVVPKLSRVAVLWNPEALTPRLVFKHLKLVAPAVGLNIESVEFRNPGELDSAYRFAKERAGGLMVVSDLVSVTHQRQIVDLARKYRLPASYADAAFVQAGGLFSYGASIAEMSRRAAYYVDRILKGAKPADLPVEQPTKFELVINLKTAKQIGLTIPPNVLARADRVIR